MPFPLRPSSFLLCVCSLGSARQTNAQALPGLPKIRDIAGPLPVAPPPPEGISTSTWVLISVASLCLLALLFWFFTRDKIKPSTPASLLAARARLREASVFVPDDPANELTTRLTTLLRLYLGETYRPAFISCTSDDLAPSLAATPGLPFPLVEKIVTFVHTCDRSKFVPHAHHPDATERSQLHNQAREILEELALVQAGAAAPLNQNSPLPPAAPPAPSSLSSAPPVPSV